MTISNEIYRALLSDVCREDFAEFIRRVNPQYFFNWHHLVLIDALQRLADRKYKRLIVMMPPRHGKSELVSRLFPAWILGRNPNEQIIVASYSLDLASAMNRDCQRIISSDQYRKIFPESRISEGRDTGAIRTQKRFDVVGHKGHYVAAGVGGGITGVGATIGIIDDPVKNSEEADSPTYRQKNWEWYTSTFKTRFEPGAVEVICQTRWHEDDLTGRILKAHEGDPETEIICLPAICETKEQHRKIGDALWESKYPVPALNEKRADAGTRTWSALYQQRPSPEDGDIIQKRWFQRFDKAKLPAGIRVNFYVDTAYTDQEKNDPCAIMAYTKQGANFYILGCAVKYAEFPEQIRFVEDFVKRYGSTASIVRVEPKATGKSLVQVMKAQTRMNIIEAMPPQGSKLARVNSITPHIEGGRVYVPDTGEAWIDDLLTECAAFPNAAHDDRVDCLSGMIINESRPKGSHFVG